MAESFLEADLYEPVKDFFTKLGYEVRGEVKGIDAVAVKEDEMIALEMKKSFNIKLLYQAIERQRVTGQVYVVIPRPKKARDVAFLKNVHIARSLSLGLITVAMDSRMKSVDIVAYPSDDGNINIKKRNAVLKELTDRKARDGNTGGSRGKKQLTAYREKCIQIAVVLYQKGPMPGKLLVRDCGCDKDATGIMRRNVYGWFDKLDKGIYDLSVQGRAEIESGGAFKDAVEFYKAEYVSSFFRQNT